MKKKKPFKVVYVKKKEKHEKPVNKEEFMRLGWFLIRQRLLYYHYPEYEAHIPDREYDKLEEKYKSMCRILGEKPTAIQGSEPKMDRPSVRLVDDAIQTDIKIGIIRKRAKC